MDYTRFTVSIWVVVLVAALAAAPDAGARDRRARAEAPTLVVVHSDNTPPLSFKGINSTPKGLVFDFWKAWSAQTGIHVTFVQTDWPTSLKMMREGTADVHGGLYYTRDRDAYLDFTIPLFRQVGTLFVRASLPIKAISDLRGRYVAVLEQGYSETWLREHHPELKRRPYKTSRQMVEAARAGEVDALLTEYATLVYQLGTTGQYKDFVSLEDMYEVPIKVAVAQGRSDLLAVVERGIRDMGEARCRKIYERWIIPDDALPGWLWPAAGVGLIALVIGLAAFFSGGRRLG